MSKDKLLYSYLGAWNTNILEYSKLFPKSLILHKRKKAIINDGILYGGVGGIPVVFGNSTGTAGYWTGNSDDITEYYEGLSVIYVKGINGATTTYLNINDLGNIEVFKNNIKIGNEHAIGSPILLTYINGKWQTTDINTNDVNLTKETTITNSSYYLTFVQEKEGFQTTYTTSSLYYQGDTLYTTYISGKLKNNISLWGQDCDFSTNIDGDISDTGDILPKVDVSYNIGSGSLRYNNVYGQRFVGRADTVASSQDNTTKFYFVGVTGANQSLKFDNTIYTTNNTGNLFARRIYLGNTPPPENTTYNLYVTGKGYLSGELTSDKFITKNYDNSYVLLAGGNVKKIDSFGDGVYLPLIGGTLTGDIYYKDSNNTSYLYLNEKNSGLFVGGSGNLTSNAVISTNGNVYLTLKAGNTYFKHNIVGGNGVSVTSDSNGKISITNTLPHKVQHLYIGLVDVNANAAATNPYLKLFDDTNLSHQYQIKGSGGTTVSSDANGNITISSSTTSHTHQIKINNTTYTIPYTGYVDCGWYIEKLPWWNSGSGQNVNDITSGVTFAYTNHNAPTDGTIAVFSSRSNSYQLQIQSSYNSRGNFYYRSKNGDNGTWLDWTKVIDTANYTSYIDYHLYIGDASSNSNTSITNPYIKLFNLTSLKHQYRIIGGTGITVASDSNGHITITNSAPNTDYRVTQNSDSTNTEYRLLFKYSANDTNETTTVKYNTKFRYNPSTGNIFNNGNLFIDTGDNDRYIHFRYNSNNYAGASWRLISRGSGSGDTNYFDIETGGSGSSNNTWYRVIRLTMDNRYVGIGTDSPSSKLHVNEGLLKITNNSNTVTIGSANSSWCHFENSADIPFYFNKAVHVNGDIRLYNGTAWIQSSNGHMYANGFHHRSINNDNYVLLAGGSYKEWNEGYKVSTIVARNASGQIYCSHLNTTSNDMNSTAFTKVFVSNDNWIRYVTKSKFAEALNAEDTVSFTKSLKVTQAWMDADIAINTTNFPKGNGAYAVLIDATSLGDSTDLWPSIYSGVMTIYTSGTNATGSDEVILHRAGHASAKRLYLRTTQNNSGNYKIQVAASNDFSVAKSLVFKFRKLI